MIIPTDLDAQPFVVCALATFGIQFCGYVVAFMLQTEKFYDILGSGNFIFLGLWTFFSSPSSSLSSESESLNSVITKPLICTILFVISRLWLLMFLAWRAHDRKGDARFDGVKENPVWFFVYWMVQAEWVYLVSLPTIYINMTISATTSPSLSTNDVIWMVSFALGIVIEIVADVQKTIWVKKGRPGGFCNVGIWKFSRHPNYFGEMLQWWSSFLLVSLSNDDIRSWLCIASPFFTSWILLFAPGTGLTDAEGDGLKRYYNNPSIAKSYEEYRSKTSILVPLVGYAPLPMLIKRILLFEWGRYEYKPSEGNKKE